MILPLVTFLGATLPAVFALPQSLPSLTASSGDSASDRANAVKAAFSFAWDGYYKYAFPNDELYPMTNGYGNDRNGWGASAIDALSTAILMENVTIVNEILAYVPTIDFSVSYEDEQVSLFETTIRYLAGMLSAYDLLTGPFSALVSNTTLIEALLTQATKLGDNLSFAFDSPSGIPYNNLYFNNRSNDGSTTNGLATIGTLVLEWSRLSDLTGNTTYTELAQKGESYLINPQSQPGVNGQPFPGMLGTDVDIATGLFVDSVGGWNGGDDSFYEYLLKSYVYDPSRYGTYKDRWVLAADSTIKYLNSHPSSRPDITYIAAYVGTSLRYVFSHLGCFSGGNFILGGLVLDNPEYLSFGLAVTEGCHNTYISTATGIGPEIFRWTVSNSSNTSVPIQDLGFYNEHGFYITVSDYALRPEVIESYYYAWRATGDVKWQDAAWEAFQAITTTCRVGSGYSEIMDVNIPGGGGFYNFQDSFLFAEVLKYSYLIFAEGGPLEQVQLKGEGQTQAWVFNTEAHPLKVKGPQYYM